MNRFLRFFVNFFWDLKFKKINFSFKKSFRSLTTGLIFFDYVQISFVYKRFYNIYSTCYLSKFHFGIFSADYIKDVEKKSLKRDIDLIFAKAAKKMKGSDLAKIGNGRIHQGKNKPKNWDSVPKFIFFWQHETHSNASIHTLIAYAI